MLFKKKTCSFFRYDSFEDVRGARSKSSRPSLSTKDRRSGSYLAENMSSTTTAAVVKPTSERTNTGYSYNNSRRKPIKSKTNVPSQPDFVF